MCRARRHAAHCVLGLKGRHVKAQGAALGSPCQGCPSPARAKQGAITISVPPFQGGRRLHAQTWGCARLARFTPGLHSPRGPRGLGRLNGSRIAHWDREPRRAAFPGGRFGGLSGPPDQLGAGKPPEPAAWKGCPTGFTAPMRGSGIVEPPYPSNGIVAAETAISGVTRRDLDHRLGSGWGG